MMRATLLLILGMTVFFVPPVSGQVMQDDTTHLPGRDSLYAPSDSSKVQDSIPKNQNNALTPPSFIPKEAKKNYGTITEIKRKEEYNPKETLTRLKKGNFGKPVNYAKDSIHWKKGAFFGVDLNQGTLTNWAAGGDHFSLALGLKANLHANYSDDHNSWDNNVGMELGFLRTSSQGTRKSTDKIELYSKYGYRFSKHWYYSVLVNFRSQFANGYNYPDDSSVVSHFFAPGYVLGSIGISYQPKDQFSIFLSPATSRFVIVNDQNLANEGAFGVQEAKYTKVDDGYEFMSEPGKKLSYELGAYMSLIFKKELLKNVNWNTRLELYSNYLDNPQNIDVHWTSLLSCRVNDFISASLNTELIYDDNVKYVTYAKTKDGSIKTNPTTGEKVVLKKAPRIQFKELIGLGFAYQF